ncbi:HAD family hydrolase [Flexithrix dorotheae]|uniref:HAD family hydrolase n=1 Tax=Flexithrix dorotheae TaxID=70993 RepID=UPI00037D1C31|nr:HAD family phosphatase [Flexithrix dorotheae]
MKDFAAIFDMDGVIVDSNPFHKISLNQFSEKYGKTFTEEELRQNLYGRRNSEWIPYLFGEDLSAEDIEKYSVEKEALFREIYKDDIVALPGLEDFLKLLESNSIAKAVATSAPRENVDFTLKMTNLEKYYPIILDSSHVSKGKPDPEVYLKTAEALRYLPEHCIVFEDSLPGVESAKRAGAKVVGLATTHSAKELADTDLVIDDFRELTLEKLYSIF